jgi:hypothetical protein
MNILLTPNLLNFLAQQGYTHFLAKKAGNQHAFTQLTPIWSELHLRQLQDEHVTLLSIKELEHIPDDPDKQFFLVAVDKVTLVSYVTSLIKTPEGRKEYHE